MAWLIPDSCPQTPGNLKISRHWQAGIWRSGCVLLTSGEGACPFGKAGSGSGKLRVSSFVKFWKTFEFVCGKIRDLAGLAVEFGAGVV